MAYVDNTENDPNKQPAGGSNPGADNSDAPSTEPATSSGDVASAPVQATGQGVAAQPNASKAPQFQNLGAYLSANAPQTAKMGQNIATGLQNTATQTQGAIDQAQGQFNNAVKQGSTSLDQNLLNQATSDPTKFASDSNNVKTIQGYLNSSYKGPTDFSQSNGYGNLASSVQNAVQQGQNANAPGGLQQLVSSQEKAPTAGIQNLDALLLKQSPDAQSAIQNAAKPLTGLGDYLTNASNTANSAATNAADITAKVAPTVQQAFAPVTQNFQQGLTAAQQQAENQRNAYNTSLNEANQKISPAQAALKAFGASIGQDINSPFSSILGLSPNNQQTTLENTATPEQFAEDQALSQLLGSGYNTSLNPSLANNAGSFTASNPLNLNYGDLESNAYKAAQDAEGIWSKNTPHDLGFATTYQNQVQPAFNSLLQSLQTVGGLSQADLDRIIYGAR